VNSPKTGDEQLEIGQCAWCGESFTDLSNAPPARMMRSTFIEGLGYVHRACFADAYNYQKARNEARHAQHAAQRNNP